MVKVKFLLSWLIEDVVFKCESVTIYLETNKQGEELKQEIYRKVKEKYKPLFDFDNFIIHIIEIQNGG